MLVLFIVKVAVNFVYNKGVLFIVKVAVNFVYDKGDC